MENRFCSNCGAPLDAAAHFCPQCGSTVETPTEAEAVSPPADSWGFESTGEVPVGPPAGPVGPPAGPAGPPAGPVGPVGPPVGPAVAAPPPSMTGAAPVPVTAAVPAAGLTPGPRRNKGLMIGLAVAVVALVAGLVVVLRGGGSDESSSSTSRPATTARPSTTASTAPTTVPATTAPPTTATTPLGNEVLLLAADARVPDAFASGGGAAVAVGAGVNLPILDLAPSPTPDVDSPRQGAPAQAPALYAGTFATPECDLAALASGITAEPARAAAWASIVGILPSSVDDYLEALVPVVLTRDTRVTDHGYAAGAAVARHAVLQAGQPVLVDSRGEPRVACISADPLTPMVPTTASTSHAGTPWKGFDPAYAVVVEPADGLEGFTLVDLRSGLPFVRSAGQDDRYATVEVFCSLYAADPMCSADSPSADKPVDEAIMAGWIAERFTAQEATLFDNGPDDETLAQIYNGATEHPVIEVKEPTVIMMLATLHVNGGAGAKPGTLSLRSYIDDTVYGPWPAVGREQTSGDDRDIPNAMWFTPLYITVPAGVYEILDSDEATWSWMDDTYGFGVAVALGYPADGAWDDEGTDATGNHPEIAILDSVLSACGYTITEYTDNGPGPFGEGELIIAQTPRGPAEFIVISADNIQVNDQIAADIAVECGFYQP